MRVGFPSLTAAIFGAALFISAAEPPATRAGDDVPVPSFAEQLRRQWTIEDVKPKVESEERLRSRDAAIERLSLREAVATALENNPALAVERLGPQFARIEIDRAFAIFDPVVSFFAETGRIVEPTGSALAGAEKLRQKTNDFGASFDKLLRTGTRFSIDVRSNELETNSDFIGLRPQYKPTVEFSLAQPLLRNFGADLTILLVRSAEAGSAIAYYEYKRQIATLIRDVVDAYWGVVQAKENLKAERDGLELARTLERENDARVRAGVLPPVAAQEAQAEAARREERVIAGENVLSISRERLRLLLQTNPNGTFLPRAVEPIDSPEVRHVDPDEGNVLANAAASRPEILRAQYEISNQKILAKLTRNSLLPSLDVYGSYGLNGLSGRPVPQRDFQTGETVFSPFTGGYDDALDRLASNDFHSYSGGVSLSVPLGNAAAEADFIQSEIALRRAELRYRQLVSDMTLEALKAVGDVRTNSKRITTTRLARELAEENVRHQGKRYEVGLGTTKDLLDFQEKLTSARAAEIRALIEYNVSLAELRRAEGALLGDYDVVVEPLAERPQPLWAAF